MRPAKQWWYDFFHRPIITEIHLIMNFKRSITTAFATMLIGLASVPAMAELPGKEIRIDQENFAKLNEAEQARVLEIADRLEAIHATDRSALSKAERAELRSELRQLKEEVKAINAREPIIYISATALVIIILLIILL